MKICLKLFAFFASLIASLVLATIVSGDIVDTSKGLPKDFIDQANDELSSINLAYDKIKEQRGIN